MKVASWIASEANRRKPSRVVVDEIGIGAGVLDRLKALDVKGVKGMNVGASAEKGDLYQNKRSEVFWRLREALEKGKVSLPDSEALLAELSAFRFSYTSNGKIALEKKAETKKRVGRSPDLADAVALGFPGAMVTKKKRLLSWTRYSKYRRARRGRREIGRAAERSRQRREGL